MAGQSSAMFGWSWTEVSVLGSQVFGQALMESCDCSVMQYHTNTSYQLNRLSKSELFCPIKIVIGIFFEYKMA